MSTVLVTGATDGLGRALATRLAREGATVIAHARSEERGREALSDLLDGPGDVRLVVGDLASLSAVRALADQVPARLDVLVNNAGIGFAEGREESADGYELRFAVNYLAGFLLASLLRDRLVASAPARIVNVASAGQYPIDFDDVMLEREYDGARAYRQSKLAQIMFGFSLAEQLPADEVTVNSLHPATFMPTKIVLDQHGHSVDSLEEGVEATLRLAGGEDVEGVSGRYFNRQVDARAEDQAYDATARRRLWDL